MAAPLKLNRKDKVADTAKLVLDTAYDNSSNYFGGANADENTKRYLQSAVGDASYQKKMHLKRSFILDPAQVKIDYLAMDESIHAEADALQKNVNNFYLQVIGYGNEKARALSTEIRNMYIAHLKKAVDELYAGIDVVSLTTGYGAPRTLEQPQPPSP